jgi:hypothetical protein
MEISLLNSYQDTAFRTNNGFCGRRMVKRVRVGLSEAHINTLLKISSGELIRQITHNSVDPLLTEVTMKIVKAKEKFMPIPKGKGEPVHD